jgi:hypothetical protein
MTRVMQWKARRAKYMRQNLLFNNNRFRTRFGPNHPLFPNAYGHSGLWERTFVKTQLPPRVSGRTYRKQTPGPIRDTAAWHISGGGFKDPPHAAIEPSVYEELKPGWNFRVAVVGLHLRAVGVYKRNGRDGAGRNRKTWAARVYYLRRGGWPEWDPNGRTPVDITPIGEDDDW